MAYEAMPAGGKMLLQTSLLPSKQEWEERNLPVTMPLLRFLRFIMREIFPGGRLPSVAIVEEHAVKCGFEVDLVQSLRHHYPRTHDIWAASLSSNKAEAIAVQSRGFWKKAFRSRATAPVRRVSASAMWLTFPAPAFVNLFDLYSCSFIVSHVFELKQIHSPLTLEIGHFESQNMKIRFVVSQFSPHCGGRFHGFIACRAGHFQPLRDLLKL